jgi:hypothetical protein
LKHEEAQPTDAVPHYRLNLLQVQTMDLRIQLGHDLPFLDINNHASWTSQSIPISCMQPPHV